MSDEPFKLRDLQSVYAELRLMAHRLLAKERLGHTLQPTALVHEALLRWLGEGWEESAWNNRAHFFRSATLAMRQVLISYARRRNADKRFEGKPRVDIEDVALLADDNVEQFVALEEALERLERSDELEAGAASADAVRLRIYGGFSNKQIAEWLGTNDKRAAELLDFGLSWIDVHRV